MRQLRAFDLVNGQRVSSDGSADGQNSIFRRAINRHDIIISMSKKDVKRCFYGAAGHVRWHCRTGNSSYGARRNRPVP
jgi:hypothetical protein